MAEKVVSQMGQFIPQDAGSGGGEAIIQISDSIDENVVNLTNLTLEPLLTVSDIVIPAGYIALLWLSLRVQFTVAVPAEANGDIEGQLTANAVFVQPQQQIRMRLLTGSIGATDTDIRQAGSLTLGPTAGTYEFVFQVFPVFGANSMNIFQSRMTIFALKLPIPPP